MINSKMSFIALKINIQKQFFFLIKIASTKTTDKYQPNIKINNNFVNLLCHILLRPPLASFINCLILSKRNDMRMQLLNSLPGSFSHLNGYLSFSVIDFANHFMNLLD